MRSAIIFTLPLLAGALAFSQQPAGSSADPSPEQQRRDVAGRDSDPAKIAARALGADRSALAALCEALAAGGVQVDRKAREIRFRAEINRSRMPIEYLLVTTRGATHESLLRTSIQPSLLTSAVYLLGLEKGRNVQFVPKDPPPDEEELRAGVSAYDMIPPSGDGVVIYVEWEYQGRLRRYRAEDLIITEREGRAMPWTSWVFLGSRFIRPTRRAPEVFGADIEGNVISVCYFAAGNQVFTNPHPLAKDPVFWPNFSLLPEFGTAVTVVLCTRPGEPSVPPDSASAKGAARAHGDG